MSTSDDKGNGLPKLTQGVAVALLIGFAALVVVLLLQVTVEEVVWTRMAWIFSAVEAVAFAAAGALFGTSVTRQRAEKAENRADSAEERGRQVQQLASNGEALARALTADADALEADQWGMVEGPEGRQVPWSQVLVRRHAELARELFPY